jgi:succinate dehydrogenase/fumarate reductase flavoprotein subunit
MAFYAPSRDLPRVPASQVRELAERWSRPLAQDSGDDILAIRERLEDLMWEKVGVVRNGTALREAMGELPELRDRAERAKISGGAASNAEWNELINVVNLCLVGEMVAHSAEIRKESRGAHYRQDHPARDPAWVKNIVLRGRENRIEFSFQPVDCRRMSPEGMHATHANDLRHH